MVTEIQPNELEKLSEGVEKMEKKMPVFIVLKNNSILKNIFLIDSHPSPSNSAGNNTELEELLMVGRDPGCDITLEDPNISGFHLQIHSIPALESLVVMDLSSVQGTWVSGKKVESGVRVEFHEGDTLQLGDSTSEYRVHWVPLSRAYDMKNPFVPPLDGSNLLSSGMNVNSPIRQLPPSAPLMPEDIQSPFSFEDAENKISFMDTLQQTETAQMPLQSLLMKKTTSEASVIEVTLRGCKSVGNMQIRESIHPSNTSSKGTSKIWTMVIDAACLLNKESRKALELMQCLHGTSLIIPRIVIRELDWMNKNCYLFRRKKEVSSTLQWIKDCMVNTKWWIHVQSSVEDAGPIAPTSQSWPFSPFGSSLNIVTPTTEDHILECALFFRKTLNEGQFVILSDDDSLTIKAMAEGLLCETAKEFSESLVNPLSERFLWPGSSPRGPTWSCCDDVLRESCEGLKAGEAAKGLKLMLLHNSNYKRSNTEASRPGGLRNRRDIWR